MCQKNERSITQKDSILFIIKWLRMGSPTGALPNYGYDIYIPNVIQNYIESELNIDKGHIDVIYQKKIKLSPIFYNAAWELCRRGIIRPGVRSMDDQSTESGSAGNGYSITPFGRQWINESDKEAFVPTEPDRFAEMLKPFHNRFGSGFYERGQQAVRCYGAHAYLACCAMCGAAAESIMLAIAIAKDNDEGAVLKTYSSANGRSKIENMIIGKAVKPLQINFKGFTELIKYWRDEAAHGKVSNIGDNEAFTSLAMLLRFANYVNEYWDELTKTA